MTLFLIARLSDALHILEIDRLFGYDEVLIDLVFIALIVVINSVLLIVITELFSGVG